MPAGKNHEKIKWTLSQNLSIACFHARKQRKKENVLSELQTMPVTNKTFRLVSINKSIGYIYEKK